MTFLHVDDIQQIVSAWANADNEMRQQGLEGDVADENSHTDQLMLLIRKELKYQGFDVVARRLKPKDERRLGVDAAFFVLDGMFYKLLLLEAKLPRLVGKSDAHRWDSSQGDKGSHFSSQLKRQSRVKGSVAIAEIFYSHEAIREQDPSMMNFGSTCVISGAACRFDAVRPGQCQALPTPWTAGELRTMFAGNCMDIPTLIHVFLNCRVGSPAPTDDGPVTGWLDKLGVEARNVMVVSSGENRKSGSRSGQLKGSGHIKLRSQERAKRAVAVAETVKVEA